LRRFEERLERDERAWQPRSHAYPGGRLLLVMLVSFAQDALFLAVNLWESSWKVTRYLQPNGHPCDDWFEWSLIALKRS
jgi:hypothetical protein